MYYILKNDGTFIFEQAYPLDFCIHCLMCLIDTDDPLLKNCKLVSFERLAHSPTRRGACPASVPESSIFNQSTISIDKSVYVLAHPHPLSAKKSFIF